MNTGIFNSQGEKIVQLPRLNLHLTINVLQLEVLINMAPSIGFEECVISNSVQSSKWFEPGSISRSSQMLVWARVVLKRTAVGDGCFDNPSGSHLQRRCSLKSKCQSPTKVLYTGFVPYFRNKFPGLIFQGL